MRKQTVSGSKGKVLMEKVKIDVYCDKRLRTLCEEFADEENVPLSEYLARVIANAHDRPDLADVPRKKMGRKRKIEVAVPA